MKDLIEDKKILLRSFITSIAQYILSFFTSGLIFGYLVNEALSDLDKINFVDVFFKYLGLMILLPVGYAIISLLVYVFSIKIFVFSEENLKKFSILLIIFSTIFYIIANIFFATSFKSYISSTIVSIVFNIAIIGIAYLIGKRIIKDYK